MNGIPVISQGKSLIQLACGQPERAWETQIDFSRQCPGVSQLRSAYEAGILNDYEAARETQKECGRFLGGLVDGIPVAGHVKGGIHYACGDSEGGDSAMKASSHSSAVLGGGVLGFMAGGPVGAAAAGIAAGAAMDATITIVDTKVNGRMDGNIRTYGIIEPFSDPRDAGKWVDAGCGVVLDGLAARGAGKIAGRNAIAVVGESSIEGAGRRASILGRESNIEGAGRRASILGREGNMEGAGRRASVLGREGNMEGAGRRTSAVVRESNLEGAGRHESSDGRAPTIGRRSVSVTTTWPSQVTVSPNMTTMMMIRNECFYFFLDEMKGKAKVIILQDLLTDVGPMLVRFSDKSLSILFRNLTWIFKDASSKENILKKEQVYTLNVDGFICKWNKLWDNPDRVELLNTFLDLVNKK